MKIKLNEITKTGFYTTNLKNKLTIFEVMKNHDKCWLKDDPNTKLIIDEWDYDFTDDKKQKHYSATGNMYGVCYAKSLKVSKIEDTKYKAHSNGTEMHEIK